MSEVHRRYAKSQSVFELATRDVAYCSQVVCALAVWRYMYTPSYVLYAARIMIIHV